MPILQIQSLILLPHYTVRPTALSDQQALEHMNFASRLKCNTLDCVTKILSTEKKVAFVIEHPKTP